MITAGDPRWTALLDQLEADLREYADRLAELERDPARFLDGSGPIPLVPDVEHPDDLGPLPVDLMPRATRLVATLELLETQVIADAAAVAAEIDGLRQRHGSTTRPAAEPAMFDQHA